MSRSVFLSAILMLGGRGGSFLLILIYSHFLNSEQFGYLSLLVSIATVGAVVSQFGGQNFFLKETVLYKERGDFGALQNIVVCFTVLCILGASGYVLLYSFWGVEGFFHVIPAWVVFLCVLSLSVISIYCASIRSGLGVYQSQIIEQIIKPGVAIFLFLLIYVMCGDAFLSGITSYALSVFLCGLLAIGTFFYGTKDFEKKRRSGTRMNGAKSVAVSAFPIYLLSLSRLMTGEITPVLSSYYLDIDAVGVVRFYMQICLMISFPLVLANYYYGPKFSSLFYEKKYNQIRAIMKRVSFWGAGGAIILFALFSVFFIFKLDWFFASYLIENTLEFFLMGIAAVFNVFFGPVGLLLLMSGNARNSLMSVLVAGLANVFLLYFLAPAFGIIGVAWAFLISTMGWNLMMFFIARKVILDLERGV